MPNWQTRQYLVRTGRCTRCTRPMTEDERAYSKQCKKCLINQRAQKKAKRDADRASGICTLCRKKPAVAGRAACASCLDRDRKARRLRWSRRSPHARPGPRSRSPHARPGKCVTCKKVQYSPHPECVTCRTNRRISDVWRKAREAREAKKAVDGQGANVT